MAVNEWLPVATTALGGLLAAGGGWLSQWAGSRGSEKRVREERRHSAYGAFIAASKELPVLAQEAYNSADTEEQRPWLDEVTTLARTITRTFVDVTLAGPRGATEAAEAVQRKAWRSSRYSTLAWERTMRSSMWSWTSTSRGVSSLRPLRKQRCIRPTNE
jgi:hypothetical protein